MKYYFAQHGKALSSDVDITRSLSAEGIEETQSVADVLKRNHISISNIVHSGKERAAKTAEIIGSSLGIKSAGTLEGMSPNDDAILFIESILSADLNHTLFIGHLPHIQKAVSYLLTETITFNTITFKNSAVLCIETNEDNASILWYITPDTI